MIPGTEVNLGGVTFNVPPLNFNNLQARAADIKMVRSVNVENALDGEMIAAMHRMIFAAISQNHKDVTMEQIGDLLTPANAPELIPLVMGATPGKKAIPATVTGSPSTGDGSMPTSLLQPDGVGSTSAST